VLAGQVPAALVVYDANGLVVDANDAALVVLGLSKADLIGSSAESANWLIVESPPGTPLTVHPAVAAIKSRQAVRGVLVRAHRPDGTDVWLQVDVVPEESNPADGARVVANLTDVTHLIAHSRATNRSSGDHIVDEVTDQLAQTRLNPHAILSTLTKTLSRLKPGVWVASLMGKDPTDMLIVASNDDDDGQEKERSESRGRQRGSSHAAYDLPGKRVRPEREQQGDPRYQRRVVPSVRSHPERLVGGGLSSAPEDQRQRPGL